MRTGNSGFVERSRVQAAVRAAAGGGAASASPYAPGATLDVDGAVAPTAQAEQLVDSLLGRTELEWARRRMGEYQKLREMRLKIANFRHDLLRRAVDFHNNNSNNSGESSSMFSSFDELKRAVLQSGVMAATARHCAVIATATATAHGAAGEDDANDPHANAAANFSSGGEDSRVRNFLSTLASPEQLAAFVSPEAMRAIEQRVDELRQALHQQYAAEAGAA